VKEVGNRHSRTKLRLMFFPTPEAADYLVLGFDCDAAAWLRIQLRKKVDKRHLLSSSSCVPCFHYFIQIDFTTGFTSCFSMPLS